VFPSAVSDSSTRLDLHEDAETNKVTATFELPGLNKEDIKIDVSNNQLVVSGESNTSSEKTENGYTVRERRSGKFSRALPLPKGTKPEDIAAKLEHGVLTITFPKTNPDQAPARITVA
jgi:HSP20 family protein